MFKKQRHTCPRRVEGPQYDVENQDFWSKRDGRRSCNYCGSIHPDDFMTAVRHGKEIAPTNKNYKAYLSDPWAKFYFQHLNENQMREFVDLINAQAVNIGYPGHFYRSPFFMAPVEDSDAI